MNLENILFDFDFIDIGQEIYLPIADKVVIGTVVKKIPIEGTSLMLYRAELEDGYIDFTNEAIGNYIWLSKENAEFEILKNSPDCEVEPKMTNQQAIQCLKEHFRIHKAQDKSKIPYFQTPYLDKASKMAIDALEKMTPKNAVYIEEAHGLGVYEYEPKCPTCGADLDNEYICTSCGQRINS